MDIEEKKTQWDLIYSLNAKVGVVTFGLGLVFVGRRLESRVSRFNGIRPRPVI